MYQVKNKMFNLIIALLATVISYIYTYCYRTSRKITVMEPEKKGMVVYKTAACICFNLIICTFFTKKMTTGKSTVVLLLLMLADTDILIKKIPTELLILTAFGLCLIKGPEIRSLPFPGAVLFPGIALYVFREKIGIAFYDICLFILLGIFVYSIDFQAKYFAVFLILWGLAGGIFGLLQKKERTIPLAPFLVLSFFLCSGFSSL